VDKHERTSAWNKCSSLETLRLTERARSGIETQGSVQMWDITALTRLSMVPPYRRGSCDDTTFTAARETGQASASVNPEENPGPGNERSPASYGAALGARVSKKSFGSAGAGCL